MDILFFRPSFYCLVCVLHTLYGRGEGGSCAVTPTISPSHVLVEHGHALSVNCSMCDNSTCYRNVKWEAPGVNYTTWESLENGVNVTIKQWTEKNVTDYGMRPQCCVQILQRSCCSHLHVTLYKRPDNVSLSFVNHTGPLIEGHQYTLQCHVQKVAPVQNFTVSIYRGDEMLDWSQSTDPVGTPVTKTLTISINSSRDDNRVQYKCEAVRNLGPQLPLMRWSDYLNTTVHFKPEMVAAPQLYPISITEGDILQLNCTADANPSPTYSWIVPNNATVSVSVNSSVLTVPSTGRQHGGLYVCVASNNQGSATIKFNVSVSVDLLPIFAGLAVLVLVVAGVVAGFLYSYHYRHTRTGHYKLKDVFRIGRHTTELQNR